MSGVDIQDLTTVVIGKRTSKSGSNAGSKKQPGVVGIKGTLESGVARKLDDNEVKAPDTVGPKVGKVSQRAISLHMLHSRGDALETHCVQLGSKSDLLSRSDLLTRCMLCRSCDAART